MKEREREREKKKKKKMKRREEIIYKFATYMLEVTIKILIEEMVDYVVPCAVELSVSMASPPFLNSINNDRVLLIPHLRMQVLVEGKFQSSRTTHCLPTWATSKP